MMLSGISLLLLVFMGKIAKSAPLPAKLLCGSGMLGVLDVVVIFPTLVLCISCTGTRFD